MENRKSGCRKSLWRFVFALVAALGGIGVIRLLLAEATEFAASEAVSVGIIGGADGPTVIFVTGELWTVYALPCILLITGLTGYLLLRRFKEKK